MLDLTSYRRKDKFSQSITIMRELYHEYNRQPKTLKHNLYDDVDALTKRTISVDKFDHCYKKILGDGGRGRQSTAETQGTRSYSKGESRVHTGPYFKNRKESDFFRSEFSQTVSLLNPHPGVKPSVLDNGQLLPREDLSPFAPRQPSVRNPSNLFTEMKKKKQELEEQSQQKKARMKVMRHNWIVNNLYQCKSADTLPKFRVKPVGSFETTKQNIFPSV